MLLRLQVTHVDVALHGSKPAAIEGSKQSRTEGLGCTRLIQIDVPGDLSSLMPERLQSKNGRLGHKSGAMSARVAFRN
jgi:hypothetical protein